MDNKYTDLLFHPHPLSSNWRIDRLSQSRIHLVRRAANEDKQKYDNLGILELEAHHLTEHD